MNWITICSKSLNITVWSNTLDFCWDLPEFDDLRNIAIWCLGSLQSWTGTSKVAFGRRYLVKTWLIEGFHSLIQADDLPSTEDMRSLGFESLLALLEMRKEMRICPQKVYSAAPRCGQPLPCPSHGKLKPDVHVDEIRKRFSDELSNMK